MANSIEIILNAGSGSHEAQDSREILEKVFRESGRSFGISVAKGEEIGRLAREKAGSDCEVLVAGGGDGTICCVAEAAREHGKTLGVLPLGTFNYFAKNLGHPARPGRSRAGHSGRADRSARQCSTWMAG